MLWITVFIVGLLALLGGLVPLLLNGLSKTNFAGIAIGTVLLAAGIAGVILHPRLPLTVPSLASIESSVTGHEPQPAPVSPESTPEAALPAAPAARVVEPTHEEEPLPSPSAKDESQLEPSALPDPVPVTTTAEAGSEPEPLTATPPTPVPSPAAAAPADDGIATLAIAAQQPKDQTAFAAVIKSTKAEFDTADDVQREAIQPKRAAAICKAVPKPEIKGWVGQIQAAEKDSGGRLTVTVALPDGTLVKTWNNAMSDIDDNTLVPAGTPLAQTFGKLQTGEAIRFAGTFFTDEPDCYRSSRLSLPQSMMEPSFLFRFTSVEKL
ncbi:hypothetical protein K32_27270 [Kaistia sp. 32K]|uniref:hypothetical protein n=1 Tax=Kaistia sp. 32K TaxID=2795690 RepID=UPI0019154CAA|nr:hypothetical protein [Kaistia sp. 32K]BCP54110.1 hypothetical protein K32_27270 [Kaistia sp. 32K]